MDTTTFSKAPAGRWAVLQDGERIGTVWDNGARRVAGRNWSWRSADGHAEGRASSRRSAADALVRTLAQKGA